MKVRQYRLASRGGEPRELRVAETGGVVFFAVHQLARCITGPLGVTATDLATLARAVADAAAEIAAAADKEPAQ